MATAPATFGDLFSAGINNFKTALTAFKPRLVPALIITVVPSVIFVLVFLLTMGSAALAGAGIMAASQSGDEASQAAAGAALATLGFGAVLAFLILIPLGAFFAFCWFRFVARANQDPTRTFGIGDLFAPDSSFMGFLGLECLLGLTGMGFAFVGTIVAVVTFFLFGLPLYFVYFFFLALCSSSAFHFFEPSSPGAVASLSRGFTLIRKDWKRWLALSVAMLGALVALVVVNVVLTYTVNKIAVVGPIMCQVVTSLFSLYLGFVMNACYRDSSAAVPQ